MSRHEISLSHVKEAVREAWRNVLSPKLPHDYASSLIKIASLRIQGLPGIAAMQRDKHATTYAGFICTKEGRLVQNALPRQIQAALELPDWLKAKVASPFAVAAVARLSLTCVLCRTLRVPVVARQLLLQAQDEKLTDQEHKKLYEEGEEALDTAHTLETKAEHAFAELRLVLPPPAAPSPELVPSHDPPTSWHAERDAMDPSSVRKRSWTGREGSMQALGKGMGRREGCYRLARRYWGERY